MDSCYISYIYTDTKGFRVPFSKEKSVQLIANYISKNGSKDYIILFRFDEKSNLILTLWIPNFYKIGDLIYPSWFESLKTFPSESVLLTPRGNFKLKDVNQKFFNYCKKIN